MGIRRSEALENLAQRTMVDELRAMVAMINQAERFGTSSSRREGGQAYLIREKENTNLLIISTNFVP